MDATNQHIKKLMSPQINMLKRMIIDEEEEEGPSSQKKGPAIQGAQGAVAEHIPNEDGMGTKDATVQPMAIDD